MGFAQFILKGRSQAALVMSFFGLLAFVLWPFAPVFLVISCAALVLVALQNDLAETITVLLLSVLACVSITWVAGIPSIGLGPVGLWLMVIVIAEVLRRSRNLALAVLSGLVLVMLTVALFFSLHENPVEMWRELIVAVLQIADLGLPKMPVEEIGLWAKLMTGAIASVVLLILVISLLIGRGWQAQVLKSDGFRREFYQLRLGRFLTVIALVFLVLSIVTESALLLSILIPMVAVYLFQGLAVIHSFVAKQAKNGWPITVFYILLILFQQLVILVSLLGIVDAWLDSRRRWLKSDAG